MYHVVQLRSTMRRSKPDREKILERSLDSFTRAGTLDLSLDQLATMVGVSKRMLIHYFGSRQALEKKAVVLLEEKLRERFAPERFPKSVSYETVAASLWDQTTASETKGVLLLLMDISRRAWKGSRRERAFYQEQQKLWANLLTHFLPDQARVEQFLLLFQGAVLMYLITGDPEPGRRALLSLLSKECQPPLQQRGSRKPSRAPLRLR